MAGWPILGAFHKARDELENTHPADLAGDAQIEQAIVRLTFWSHKEASPHTPAIHDRDHQRR
jgi:hypothetical protein